MAEDAHVVSLAEGAGALRSLRVQAEHHAGWLKSLREDVPPDLYRHATSLYVDGKAAVDGWIEVMVTGIEFEGDAEVSKRQAQALEEAGRRAQIFFDFVAALPARDTERGLGDLAKVVPEAVKLLADAGMGVWRELRSARIEDRRARVARLEELRWPAFEDVSAP